MSADADATTALAGTPPAPAEWKETAKDLFSGTVAGMVSKVFEYPFDTVKVRQQTQPGLGVVECVSRTVRNEGVSALFKGLSAPLFGAAAENAVVFGAYSKTRRVLAGSADAAVLDSAPAWHTLAAGGLSGFAVSFWLTPVEYVKVQMQAEATAHLFKGPVHCVRELWRGGGLPGFYRGHTATMFRETVGGCFYFGGYVGARQLLTPAGGSSDSLSPASTMLAGACGGSAYWLATFPADTVKSRMQSGQLPRGAPFVGSLASIFRSEGLGGLYRGLGVTLSRAIPSNALIFLIYESVMKLVKDF
jgi:transmembrane carrier protein